MLYVLCHHHQVVVTAQIFLNLSHHLSLSAQDISKASDSIYRGKIEKMTFIEYYF